MTGHPEAKALLIDERIGMSHPDPATAGWYTLDDVSGRPRGGSETEYLEHGEWRRAMNKVFSPGKLAQAAARTDDVAEELISRLADADGPVDINAEYSLPLCSAVILHLLDIPDVHLNVFQEWTEDGATTGDVGRSLKGMQALLSFASRLVRERRASEQTDAVAELLRASEGGGTDAGRVVKLIAGMLAFGRETPAAALTNGILLLVTHPGELDRLRADPALFGSAVEEVLRMFRPPAATPHGLLRYAHERLTIGDQVIGKGDMVLIDIARANFDDRVFARPRTFDVGRQPNPHVTFGSGFYMCNFAKLARIQLGTALRILFTRLPELRLAGDPADLRYKTHLRTQAIEALPLTW